MASQFKYSPFKTWSSALYILRKFNKGDSTTNCNMHVHDTERSTNLWHNWVQLKIKGSKRKKARLLFGFFLLPLRFELFDLRFEHCILCLEILIPRFETH
jgi:hypothetical protein